MHTAMSNYYSRLKERMGIYNEDVSESDTEKYIQRSLNKMRAGYHNDKRIKNKIRLKRRSDVKGYKKKRNTQKFNSNIMTESEVFDDASTLKSRLFSRPSTHLAQYRKAFYSSIESSEKYDLNKTAYTDKRTASSFGKQRDMTVFNKSNSKNPFYKRLYNKSLETPSRFNRSVGFTEARAKVNKKINWNNLHSNHCSSFRFVYLIS